MRRVKRGAEQARAAIVLTHAATPDADKLAAIAIVRDRGDQDALGLLSGIPAHETSPAVAKAAATPSPRSKAHLAVWDAVQNLWYGLSLGSVLLLAAIGLAITFGVMGVINMAHGEMVMLGAYVTYVVQEIIRNNAPALFDYSLAIAIPLAFVFAGCVGILIERSIIRFLYGRPLETLLATWGLSLILQQAVRTIVRTEQPRSRQSLVYERRVRSRRHHHHLQPALDHLLRARGIRRAARACCATRASASKCAP